MISLTFIQSIILSYHIQAIYDIITPSQKWYHFWPMIPVNISTNQDPGIWPIPNPQKANQALSQSEGFKVTNVWKYLLIFYWFVYIPSLGFFCYLFCCDRMKFNVPVMLIRFDITVNCAIWDCVTSRWSTLPLSKGDQSSFRHSSRRCLSGISNCKPVRATTTVLTWIRERGPRTSEFPL